MKNDELLRRLKSAYQAKGKMMSLEDNIFKDGSGADIPQQASTSTTDSKVGQIEGEGHQITQATNVYHITNNYFKDGSLEKGYKGGMGVPNEDNEDQGSSDDLFDNSIDMPTSSSDKIIEEIAASSNDATFVNTSRVKTRTSSNVLPHNSKEIEIWYYQELDERERCFVNACAVLHGATLRAITEATRELYIAQKEKSQRREAEMKVSSLSLTEDAPAVLPPPPQMPEALTWVYLLGQQNERERTAQINTSIVESGQSSAEQEENFLQSLDALLEKTYTYSSYANGAIRIFWKDADPSGLSNFSIDLLRFLAREAANEDMFGSQSTGLRFLDIVKQWPSKYRGERSWRSANALGVIWWYQDTRNLLWRQADRWAKSQQKQDWDHAAALLDGAYQVERGTRKSGTDETVSSLVLQLLDKWIVTTHKWITVAHQTTTKRGEGYAAARAYALIGRKSPEVALQGLEQLLLFPSQSQNAVKTGHDPAEDLFIFGVLKYVDIARSGHIRQVLKHLADVAARHIHQQGRSRIRGRRDENADQRAAALHVVLTAFFLVASCSLSGVDATIAATYTPYGHLHEHPICPDNKGKDILLAGILTAAEPLWRDQLTILLASIIMEQNYASALYLMVRWGGIVLKDQSKDATLLEGAYIQFLVDVGRMVQKWSTHRGASRFSAIGAYKRQLTLWLTSRQLPHPRFKDLAQRVLKELSEVN